MPENFDMYLIVFVIFCKHFDAFSQYLVTYLVPWVKGLPGGVDLVCHADMDRPGITIERRVSIVAVWRPILTAYC